MEGGTNKGGTDVVKLEEMEGLRQKIEWQGAILQD